jgi:hypothetical protein
MPNPDTDQLAPEDVLAGRLLGEALRRAGIEKQEAAYAMGVDVSLVSRWLTGERAVSLPKVFRLPLLDKGEDRRGTDALECFAELLGAEVGIGVITRDAMRCIGRWLHYRPVPLRARLVPETPTQRVMAKAGYVPALTSRRRIG